MAALPRAGTNGMVLTCTGIPEETRQNELYLQAKDMNAHLIRDKVDSAYNNKTTHLIVGALAKTEKFLCALAAGIPMVDVSYIDHSRDANQWIQEINQYDIGSPHHPLRQGNNKLYVEELVARQARKKAGGVFKGWRVVVLIEDSRQQEIYRRLMELGGAKVNRYTLQHLADLKPKEMGQITHIITTPSMMVHEVFRSFLKKNDAAEKVPIVAYIFVGDFLTRKVTAPIHLYDIRQQAMVDMLTTREVKERLEKMGHMKPPAHMLVAAMPSTKSSAQSSSSKDDAGPSLQESPDFLEDLPDNHYDEEGDDRSPEMTRNHSQIISCDLPPDYEYDAVASSNSRKRSQQSFNPGSNSNKKVKLSDSNNSEHNSTRESEIEILKETPAKTQEEKTKGLLQLKKKAQSFMRASQVASTSQSRLDEWVTKSPRVVTMDVSSDDQEVICVEDDSQDQGPSVRRREGTVTSVSDVIEPEESTLDCNAGPEQPSRRQRRASAERQKMTMTSSTGRRDPNSERVVRSKSTGNTSSLPNHFLAKTRSGSTRSSSVRSLKASSDSPLLSSLHPLMMSQNSNASQDSFCSDVMSEVSSPVKSLSSMVSDEPGQKMNFCHNLLVQRRTLVHRIDVGHCALPVEIPQPTVTPYPLPSSMCANVWTCLDTEQELRDLDKEVDESWLAALSLLTKVVNRNRFAPVAAMHKVLEESLRDHKDTLVRTTSLTTLLHCLSMHPPGPERPELANYYLELMSKTRPYLDRWEFESTEPWEFLSGVIESCLSNQEEEMEDIEHSGYSLLLKFLTEICYSDMTRYSDYLITQDSLEPDYRPVLARILFPSESVGWSRRVEKLVKLYIHGVSINMVESNLVCVRKLVGLAAQLLQYSERSSKSSQSNSKKLEMARALAIQLSKTTLTMERLWMELYLLQPTWLSAMVSREYLAKSCNVPFKDDSPALRSLISTFIDTDLDIPEDDNDNEVLLTPSQTSTPVPARTRGKQGGAARNLSLVLSQSKSPSKKISKIKVHARNQYGETPLHQAAKKGNIARIRECLNTPGIDINSKDNSGFTPLHEAVGGGKVEAVQVLLEYVPHSYTLDKFFSVSRQNLTSPRRKVDRVDILAVDKDDGMNPIHEAVDNDNIPIVKLFFETVAREQGRPGSGLASLDSVLNSTTLKGDTVATLAKSDEMKDLIKQFLNSNTRLNDKENCLSGPLSINNKELFGLLTELSVTKYIAMNCLPHIYAMYKEVKVSEVLEAYEEDISIKLNEKQSKWGPMDLKDGLIIKQFGRRPRFEIFRSEGVKSQDIRDYENLIYYKKQYKKIDPLHPALPMLKLLKISK